MRCFENAARHLEADGAFVVETALPHAWIPPDTEFHPRVAQRISCHAGCLGGSESFGEMI